MKILCLGGAGRVGHRIAELLVKRQAGEVVRADRAEPSDDLETPFVQVDISDGARLRSLLEEYDLVVNTVGPYDKWGPVVLDAAIEAGTDYVDICDDPRPTLELLERGPKAAERGVRAVVGMGASPGLPNLLMVAAARELDSVDHLISYWGDPQEGLGDEEAADLAKRAARAFRDGRAAFHHMIVQTSEPIPVWRDGRQVDVKPWTEPWRVTLSGGETGVFRLMGHPESVTVPPVVNARAGSCIGTLGLGLDLLIRDANAKVAEGMAIPDALGWVADQVEGDPSLLQFPKQGPTLPALIGAVAIGAKDGVTHSVVAMPGGPTDGSMSFETGRVAALGAELIDRAKPGVHAPETAFDVDEALEEFSRREWDGAPPYRLDAQEGEAVRLLSDDDLRPAAGQ
jgi:hypothetical protein